jgi:hypothetical protein
MLRDKRPLYSVQTITTLQLYAPQNLVAPESCQLAAELLSARIVAAQVAVADLRVGTSLGVRHGVRDRGAGEQQSDCGDESGELHGELDATIG